MDNVEHLLEEIARLKETMNWKPITLAEQDGQPRICGWAWEGHLQVARAFHDGRHWFAIGPKADGTISRGGSAIRMAEAPTHWLANQPRS